LATYNFSVFGPGSVGKWHADDLTVEYDLRAPRHLTVIWSFNDLCRRCVYRPHTFTTDYLAESTSKTLQQIYWRRQIFTYYAAVIIRHITRDVARKKERGDEV